MIQHLIGKTKSQKVIDEATKIYSEEFKKKYPEYFEKNYSKAFSIVTTLKENSDEIENIGMSKVDDLLLDNWGKFLGAILTNQQQTTMIDAGGVARTYWIYSINQDLFNYVNNGAVGTEIFIGEGTTPATRGDFSMEVSKQGMICGDGAWQSGLGKITAPANVISNFNGNISEVGLFGRWFTRIPIITVASSMLSHDILASSVPVSIGQSVNVDYEVLLS